MTGSEMVRGFHTLVCFLLGMTLTLFIYSGAEGYVFVALALAVPWDKLAVVTGSLLDEYMEGRREERDQHKVEAASLDWSKQTKP
jgi:hypothetical protein